MSASGYKQTYGGGSSYVRFTPNTGHASEAVECPVVTRSRRVSYAQTMAANAPSQSLRLSMVSTAIWQEADMRAMTGLLRHFLLK